MVCHDRVSVEAASLPTWNLPGPVYYRIGKDEIFALRKEAANLLGERFSPKTFHLLFMKQGTIPAGYFREELLREIKENK